MSQKQHKSSTVSAKPAKARLEERLSELALDLVGREGFGRTASVLAKVRTKFDRAVLDRMGHQLAFLNMPSREDVESLGERLLEIDQRLIRIENMLRAQQTGRRVASSPPRTRVAPSKQQAAVHAAE